MGWKGTGGREDNISSSLFVDRQKKAVGWVLSAVCVTVLYLVQLHHDRQVLGKSGIVETREGFGSRHLEQCWGVIDVRVGHRHGTRGLRVRREMY